MVGIENETTRDYDIVAVIYPNSDNIRAIYGENCTHAQLSAEISNAVEGVNASVESHKRISKFVLRDCPFDKNEAGKIIRSDIR